MTLIAMQKTDTRIIYLSLSSLCFSEKFALVAPMHILKNNCLVIIMREGEEGIDCQINVSILLMKPWTAQPFFSP